MGNRYRRDDCPVPIKFLLTHFQKEFLVSSNTYLRKRLPKINYGCAPCGSGKTHEISTRSRNLASVHTRLRGEGEGRHSRLRCRQRKLPSCKACIFQKGWLKLASKYMISTMDHGKNAHFEPYDAQLVHNHVRRLLAARQATRKNQSSR